MVVGYIKEVRSADNYVIALTNKPEAETKTLFLSSIVAPRLASKTKPDEEEPYGFNAREHMRKQLVGQQIEFEVEYEFNGREFGWIKLNGVSVSRYAIRNGYAKLRSNLNPPQAADVDILASLQDEAKDKEVGVWNPYVINFVREPFYIEREVTETKAFFKRNANKNFPIVVEYLRDGGAFNIYAPHEEAYLSVFLNGVMVDTWKGEDREPEAYAVATKHFVEGLIFQRPDITLRVEDVDEKGNLLGSIYTPKGSLAQLLLSNGYARLHELTARKTLNFPELAKSFLEARNKRVLRWKNLDDEQPKATVEVDGKSVDSYETQVVEVLNGDTLLVKIPNAKAVGGFDERRVYLSSIRAPRMGNARANKPNEPFAFEAREFLRKRVAGKNVTVTIDYVRTVPKENNPPPPSDAEGRMHFVTIEVGGKNPIVDLVRKGYVEINEPRRVEDPKARDYDEYIEALDAAKKGKEGRFHPQAKNATVSGGESRVIDLTGPANAARAKAFEKDFKAEQAGGRLITAVVDHCANAGRYRLRVPDIGPVVISAVLSGVRAPAAPAASSVVKDNGEPFGADGLAWARGNLLQREVYISVETVDRGGNFIVKVYTSNNTGSSDVALRLLKEGLARCTEFGYEDQALAAAEEEAAKQRKGIHSLRDEKKEAEDRAVRDAKAAAEAERVIAADVLDTTGGETLGNVIVSSAQKYEEIYIQFANKEKDLESLIDTKIPAAIKANEDGCGSFIAASAATNLKVGEEVLVFNPDDEGHFRAEVTGKAPNAVHVRFIDFGIIERAVPISRVRPSPKSLSSATIPAFAHKVTLAGLRTPAQVAKEAEDIIFATAASIAGLSEKDEEDGVNAVLQCTLVHVAAGGVKHVVLHQKGSSATALTSSNCVNAAIVNQGDAFLGRKNIQAGLFGKKFGRVLVDACEEAKEGVRGIYRFGDIEEEEEENTRFGGPRRR